RINPCGYAGMEMTQMRQWVDTATPDNIRPVLLKNFLALLNNSTYEYIAA
ncbi:octanoyltransferase, partial [Enterobacter hormaechei]